MYIYDCTKHIYNWYLEAWSQHILKVRYEIEKFIWIFATLPLLSDCGPNVEFVVEIDVASVPKTKFARFKTRVIVSE